MFISIKQLGIFYFCKVEELPEFYTKAYKIDLPWLKAKLLLDIFARPDVRVQRLLGKQIPYRY